MFAPSSARGFLNRGLKRKRPYNVRTTRVVRRRPNYRRYRRVSHPRRRSRTYRRFAYKPNRRLTAVSRFTPRQNNPQGFFFPASLNYKSMWKMGYQTYHQITQAFLVENQAPYAVQTSSGRRVFVFNEYRDRMYSHSNWNQGTTTFTVSNYGPNTVNRFTGEKGFVQHPKGARVYNTTSILNFRLSTNYPMRVTISLMARKRLNTHDAAQYLNDWPASQDASVRKDIFKVFRRITKVVSPNEDQSFVFRRTTKLSRRCWQNCEPNTPGTTVDNWKTDHDAWQYVVYEWDPQVSSGDLRTTPNYQHKIDFTVRHYFLSKRLDQEIENVTIDPDI